MTHKPLKTIAGTVDQPLRIGDIEIPCYVLEDETRVLVQRGLQSGIGMSTSGGSGGAHRLSQFLGSLADKGIDCTELAVRTRNPIFFQPTVGAKTAYGYEATILADICDAVISAQRAGVLLKQQRHIAEQCDVLMRGFARIGIIGLVDEATGYQEIRARDSLAKILEKFIVEELQPWTKTFPDEFYKEMFRLRDWPWRPWDVKRPSVVGKYTNDLVYERLAPGLLDELRRKNPMLPQGSRRHRHFQWFTPDLGHPKLKEHLASVIALMRASSNWGQFLRNMNRALPKKNETMEMQLDD